MRNYLLVFVMTAVLCGCKEREPALAPPAPATVNPTRFDTECVQLMAGGTLEIVVFKELATNRRWLMVRDLNRQSGGLSIIEYDNPGTKIILEK